MGENDKAVEAFRKYASLMPNEPNPQDSLAEALLAAGRYDEAEAAFRKALELSPKFWPAWEGVASTKFLRGDWKGGREALAKAKAAATRPADKLSADELLAWSHAAEGNVAEAIKTFEAVETAAAAQKVDGFRVFGPLERATILSDTGKPADALAIATKTLDNPENAKLNGAMQNNLRRLALAVRIDAESRLSKAAEAKSTLALIEAEGKKSPTNAELQSLVHYAQGSEAMARGDATAAAQHFAQCNETDFYCRMQLVKAHEKAGNAPAASAERSRILAANRREGDYLYVRSKLSEKKS
jgi:tetratricopeptide (TPR) repeat protein